MKLHFINSRYYTDYDIERMEDEYDERRAENRRKAWADKHYREFTYIVNGKRVKLIYMKNRKHNLTQRHTA